MEKLQSCEITQKNAAIRLGISERWVRSLCRRYKISGAAGLVHGNRGKPSRRKTGLETLEFAINLLKKEWVGFGPTFASEKLKELHQVDISRESLRKEMIKCGLYTAKKRRLTHRQRRERRAMEGIMIQLDGSYHNWFEERGGRAALLVFVDDATSKIMWLEFVNGESTIEVMEAMKNYIIKHGRPHSLYVDFAGVYKVNTNNKEGEKLTQFQRAMKELEIEILHAHSPQAKGRVERMNGILQDRLIKDMRLAGISSMEQANKYIKEGNFIEKHNTRFAIPPIEEGDAHRPFYGNFETVFCLKESRVVAKDHTITYKQRLLQLTEHQSTIVRPKESIMVYEQFDGKISLYTRKTKLEFTEIGYKQPTKISPVEYVRILSDLDDERSIDLTPFLPNNELPVYEATFSFEKRN